MKVEWHSRAEVGLDPPWGSRSGWYGSNPTGLVFHHTAGPGQRPPATLAEAFAMWRGTQDFHRGQADLYRRTGGTQGDAYSDIAYNEGGCVIGDTYHVFEGRGTEARSGATSSAANITHFAHVLLGNYEEFPAPPGLADGLAARARQLNDWYGRQLTVTGHGLLPGTGGTQCPGRNVRAILPTVARLATAPPPPEPQEQPVEPIGSADLIEPSGPGHIRLAGWAGRPDGQPVAVSFWLDGTQVAAITPDLPRGDVTAAHPGIVGTPGFDRTITATPGAHTVKIVASAAGQVTTIGEQTVAVPSPTTQPGFDVEAVHDELAKASAAIAAASRLLGR